MEDWHDYISVIGGSVEAAGVAALVLCAAVYGVLRTLHAIRHRGQHTWRSDLRPLRWAGPIAFILVFLPGVLLGFLLSNACGTSSSAEFTAPDGNHRLVYRFNKT
jgi:hypothetical protein